MPKTESCAICKNEIGKCECQEYITVSWAASATGLNRRFFHNRIANGKLRVRKLKNTKTSPWLISRSDLRVCLSEYEAMKQPSPDREYNTAFQHFKRTGDRSRLDKVREKYGIGKRKRGRPVSIPRREKMVEHRSKFFNAPSKTIDGIIAVIEKTGFKFWACPICPKSKIVWDGEIAECQTCGKTNETE